MKTVALLLLVVSLWSGVASADSDRNRQMWSSLSEEQREQIRQNFTRWQSMSPEEQARLKANYEQFRTLDSGQRERLLTRFNRFKGLPPERRELIRQRFQKLMQLSPEERQKRLNELREKRQSGGRLRNTVPQRLRRLRLRRN